jgi:hypothetical protein
MVFGGDPNKRKTVFEQDHLALDKAIVFESFSGYLAFSGISTEFTTSMITGEFDRRESARISRL